MYRSEANRRVLEMRSYMGTNFLARLRGFPDFAYVLYEGDSEGDWFTRHVVEERTTTIDENGHTRPCVRKRDYPIEEFRGTEAEELPDRMGRFVDWLFLDARRLKETELPDCNPDVVAIVTKDYGREEIIRLGRTIESGALPRGVNFVVIEYKSNPEKQIRLYSPPRIDDRVGDS